MSWEVNTLQLVSTCIVITQKKKAGIISPDS